MAQFAGIVAICKRSSKSEPEKITINMGYRLHDRAMPQPITGNDNKADRIPDKMGKQREQDLIHISNIDLVWYPDIKNQERNGNRKYTITQHHYTILLNTSRSFWFRQRILIVHTVSVF